MAESGEPDGLWTLVLMVPRWRPGRPIARRRTPAPSPRCPRGRRAAAPAMPRRRPPGRTAAGIRPRALLPALLARAGCRASPCFVGGSGIRPVDCRSGGCGFESRPPRLKRPFYGAVFFSARKRLVWSRTRGREDFLGREPFTEHLRSFRVGRAVPLVPLPRVVPAVQPCLAVPVFRRDRLRLSALARAPALARPSESASRGRRRVCEPAHRRWTSRRQAKAYRSFVSTGGGQVQSA